MRFFVFIFLFFLKTSFAYIPQLSQIIRFQPRVQAQNAEAFQSQGSVLINSKRKQNNVPYVLDWNSPSNYKVRLALDIGSWTLYRVGKECRFIFDKFIVNCGEANLWALLELSAKEDWVAQSLVKNSFVNVDDASYKETNLIENPNIQNDKKSRLVIGKNGKESMTLIEIIPSGGQDLVGEEAVPKLLYEQNFLSPMLLIQKNQQGYVNKIEAETNLEFEKRSRFTPMLSQKLSVFKSGEWTSVFQRKEKTPRKAESYTLPKASSDLASIESFLPDDLKNLLEALLLTH